MTHIFNRPVDDSTGKGPHLAAGLAARHAQDRDAAQSEQARSLFFWRAARADRHRRQAWVLLTRNKDWPALLRPWPQPV
jgi:hypothetical protein